jgi:hypothetical protein
MHTHAESDLYRALGDKIDNLPARAPWSETFHAILKELYTPEEADLVVRMPYTLSSLERISRMTRIEKTRLRTLLDGLCRKGRGLRYLQREGFPVLLRALAPGGGDLRVHHDAHRPRHGREEDGRSVPCVPLR